MKAFDDVAIPGTVPWIVAGSGDITQGPVFPGGSAVTQEPEGVLDRNGNPKPGL